MTEDLRYNSAIGYIARGWKVFVLGENKTPLANCSTCATAGSEHNKELCGCLTCHGFYAATSDSVRLEAMLLRSPDGQLAVRTGAPSGIIVLDAEADPQRNGLATLDDWELWSGGWSLNTQTLQARSQSGGLHLYFAYIPGVKSRNSVLPGIDVKSDGGYVAVPSGDGLRAWLNELPIAEPDEHLAQWFKNVRGKSSGGSNAGVEPAQGYDYEQFTRVGCPGGHRDYFFNDMAWRLRKRGVEQTVATAQMQRHWEKAEQPPHTKWYMPWDHVLYKIERVWREIEPDPPPPDWRPGGASVDEPDTEHRSDTGNAHRLVRLAGADIRYVPEQKSWFVWNGNRWVPDVLNETMNKTLLVIADLRAVAEAEQNHDQQRAQANFALQSEALQRRTAMMRIAESHPKVATSVTPLNKDPWLLVVENGTLDLKTGVLRASRREDLNTRTANVTYDRDAPCPRWKEHIKLITGGNPVLASYLRRAVGYSLTGVVTEQVFFMLEGDGANGKNAFIEPIIALLGEYASVGTSALITGGDEQHPTIMADLVGARMVFIDEARQGRPLNVERVKQLTGSKTIKARRMKENFFEFDAQLKLWIAGNNHPTLRDPSDGIWRRLHRVLFHEKISPDRDIKDYGRLMFVEEAAGILNWALEGLREWLDLGALGQPAEVVAATQELKSDEDHVQRFIEERLVFGDAVVSTYELYMEFCIWWMSQGLPQGEKITQVQFARQLVKKGLTGWRGTIAGKTTRGFTGVFVQRN